MKEKIKAFWSNVTDKIKAFWNTFGVAALTVLFVLVLLLVNVGMVSYKVLPAQSVNMILTIVGSLYLAMTSQYYFSQVV